MRSAMRNEAAADNGDAIDDAIDDDDDDDDDDAALW